jgi:hypothetical protein
MRTMVVVAFAIVLSSVPALAADGRVSSSSLAKMGLPGLRPMSDAIGMKIRGQALVYPPNPTGEIGRLERSIAHELRVHYPPNPTGGRGR